MTIACVGAGFTGAVIAQQLAQEGYKIQVIDARKHVGGNCHTTRDKQTGVMVHVYGPHIFHTNNNKVWRYVQQFGEFIPFVNRVKSIHAGAVYPLPINLLTINTFFKTTMSPKEAQEFIREKSDRSIIVPETFEDQALHFVGRELYEAFFKGYTEKQWGRLPEHLPASILKRLPVRFDYNDNYYTSIYQGIPKNGYSSVVENMLDHPNIEICLNSKFERKDSSMFQHVFYSGPIDSYFEHRAGHLAYRTLDFEIERHKGDYQGNPVINYSDISVPYTRISEHKHFAPWESHEETIIYKEYSRECGEDDIPYYPIRLKDDKAQLSRYLELCAQERNVTFVGRLGTYRYIDMDITIAEALETAELFVKSSSINH